MSKVIDTVAPPRLGVDFRRLLASSWASDLGDGIALAAGPLLVLSQTRDPFLIALATILQQVPWLVFALHAGVIADRFNRRRVMIMANLARVAVLVVLVATIVTDTVAISVVLAALVLLGTAEVFVDTTSSTLLPMVVGPGDLGMANSRLMFGRRTLNQLAGPSIGAILFAVGAAVPFVTQAVCVALAVVLIARLGIAAPAPLAEPVAAHTQIAEGFRWVWANPAIRTLTITIFVFNITFGAGFAILVLYTSEQLGLGSIGFGLLTSFGALGGVLGAVLYSRIDALIGAVWIMRIGLMIEVGMHLIFAVNSMPAVAFITFFVFGLHEACWGTTSTTIRQRVVPEELQGRVSGINGLGVFSTLVFGGFLGGLIAERWGVTGPFWFGFVGAALTLMVIWKPLSAIAQAE